MPLLVQEHEESAPLDFPDIAERFEHEALPLADQLYRAARRYTRSHADAEDLVQDTMIRAYKGFPAFKDGTNIRAWLFKIMNTTWINNYRKASRRPSEWLVGDVSDPLATAAPQHSSMRARSAELEVLESLGDDEVRAALEALPEPQRMAIYYADVEGFRYKEIAEILDVPLGSVMSRLHRGRRTLRKFLTDYAVECGYVRGDVKPEVAA